MAVNSFSASVWKSLCLLILTLLWYQVASAQAPNKVRKDVQAHFIPIGDDHEALPATLMGKLKGKRIVGLGEATHGTAEFEEMFSRLAKSLIKEQGFNVVALAEANFSDTRALNDYVVHGKGDAETAIRHMRHSPLYFVGSEFKELAEWLRAYNGSRPVGERVWMLGLDALSPQGAASSALRICGELGIKLPEETRQYLEELAALPDYNFKDYAKRVSLASALTKVAPLKQALQQPGPEDKLSAEQRWLLQSAATLDDAVRFFYDNYLHEKWAHRQFRDEAMLANVQWVLKERKDAKLVVYAHNAHMEKNIGYRHGRYEARLGKLLHETYGRDFYAIGTEAQSGNFWAGGDIILAIPSNRKKIGDVIGALVDAPFGLLELNATRNLTKYFNRPLYLTYGALGANKNPASRPPVNLPTVNLSKAFDAMLYVRESTPKPRTKPGFGLKQFSLNLSLNPELVESAAKQGQITVKLNSSFSTLGTSLSNEGVSLGLLFMDKQKSVVGYHSVPLPGNEGVSQTFPLPAGTEKVLLTVSGAFAKELSIAHLEINGTSVDLDELKYYGEGYGKTIEREFGKARLVLKEGTGSQSDRPRP